MPNCYYYDEQRNRCNCYINKNLNELLDENAKLRELVKQTHTLFACADGATFSDGTPAVRAGDRREVEFRMHELGMD